MRGKIRDRERFKRAFADTPNDEVAAMFGVSVASVSALAKRLGLRKDREYITGIRRAQRLGVKASLETRALIAAKARGRQISAETKAKSLATKLQRGTLRRGDRHYRWKGGRPWERFKRPEYSAWRNSVLERDGYRCHDCGRECRKYEKGLAAHHIQSYAGHPELRYEVSNGVTLCRDCHMARHARSRKSIAVRQCACGCGTVIAAEDPYGRPRRFVNGHARRGARHTPESLKKMSDQLRGRQLTSEHRAKISAGLRRNPRRGRPPRQPV